MENFQVSFILFFKRVCRVCACNDVTMNRGTAHESCTTLHRSARAVSIAKLLSVSLRVSGNAPLLSKAYLSKLNVICHYCQRQIKQTLHIAFYCNL